MAQVRRGATRIARASRPNRLDQNEWPRGRIVSEQPARRFVIYADRRIQAPDIIAAAENRLRARQREAVVESDLHYR